MKEFPFAILFKEIFKSKEEFSLNDIHIFKNNAKQNSEMKNFNKKRDPSKPKEQISIISADHFQPKNNFDSRKHSTNLVEIKQNSSFLEKDQTNLSHLTKWIPSMNNNCQIFYDRGKTPEKNIVIKNIIPHHAFIQHNLIIADPTQVLDRSRHARQFSVHTPCYTKTNYSPYNLNGAIINNVKFVKN